MSEITNEDRDFFEELANRPADHVIEEDIEEVLLEEKNIVQKDSEPKYPDWYKPWMKDKVGFLNGIPQRPLTKEDRRRGSWKDVPRY